MANKAVLGVGIFLVLLAVIGLFYPVSSLGNSLVQVDNLCSFGFGLLTQFLSSNPQEACQQTRFISYGFYGIGIIGLALIIVGSLGSRAKKEYDKKIIVEEPKQDDPQEILKKRFAKGEISKEEFDHLERELGFFEVEREKKEYSVEELNKINQKRWETNNPVEKEFQKEIKAEIQALRDANVDDDKIEQVMLNHGLEGKNIDENGEEYWICHRCSREIKFYTREDYISHYFEFHS